jgi:hypothetical protein
VGSAQTLATYRLSNQDMDEVVVFIRIVSPFSELKMSPYAGPATRELCDVSSFEPCADWCNTRADYAINAFSGLGRDVVAWIWVFRAGQNLSKRKITLQP